MIEKMRKPLSVVAPLSLSLLVFPVENSLDLNKHSVCRRYEGCFARELSCLIRSHFPHTIHSLTCCQLPSWKSNEYKAINNKTTTKRKTVRDISWEFAFKTKRFLRYKSTIPKPKQSLLVKYIYIRTPPLKHAFIFRLSTRLFSLAYTHTHTHTIYTCSFAFLCSLRANLFTLSLVIWPFAYIRSRKASVNRAPFLTRESEYKASAMSKIVGGLGKFLYKQWLSLTRSPCSSSLSLSLLSSQERKGIIQEEMGTMCVL